MTVQPNDILEASARSEFNGTEDVVNVFQFRNNGVAPMADQAAIDDIIEILEIVYNLINAGLTLLQLYRDIRVRNVTQGLVYGTFPWATLVSGGSAVNPTAPGVAFLVSFSTGVPRVGMRKYFGVVTEDEMDVDGAFTGVLVVAGGAVISTLIAPIVATNSTWEFGYQSPKTGTFVTPNGGVATDIPAYQRRRRQGRGS